MRLQYKTTEQILDRMAAEYKLSNGFINWTRFFRSVDSDRLELWANEANAYVDATGSEDNDLVWFASRLDEVAAARTARS